MAACFNTAIAIHNRLEARKSMDVSISPSRIGPEHIFDFWACLLQINPPSTVWSLHPPPRFLITPISDWNPPVGRSACRSGNTVYFSEAEEQKQQKGAWGHPLKNNQNFSRKSCIKISKTKGHFTKVYSIKGCELKKEPFFPQPLGLFGPPDHILQNICLKLGMASFLVHIHIF